MKLRSCAIAVLLAPVALLGQHVGVINTGPTMRPPANAFPFGNILFPAGIPNTISSQTHASRLGATISGFPPYTGAPARGVFSGRRGGLGGRTVVVPYAYPVFVGGGFYDYAPPQPASNITVVVPQQPAPSVIINHNYTPETAEPVMRDYSNTELPESASSRSSSGMRVYEAPVAPAAEPERRPGRAASAPRPDEDRPTIYLIALNDGTVYSAIGYWAEGETLHYVTPQGSLNRVSLDRIDRATTAQLNRERNVDFDAKVLR
ncbi:MAG: hypothetical protein HYZ57_10540 [Acidobacteria bacterium]|nr:hypothetical protein [Acidobacteriota bacterium]MBI3280266.1 hypothetical protein [Acidobacteriota bacterium]